jgi:hypothetical protein
MRTLKRRLRKLETTATGKPGLEIWFVGDDGTISGPNGERLTREAFDAAASGRTDATIRILIDAIDAKL